MSIAVKKFEEYRETNLRVKNQWFHLVERQEIDDLVRPIIASSWKRCLANRKTDPMQLTATRFVSKLELEKHQEENGLLIKMAKPYMDQLYQQFESDYSVIMLSDAKGMNLIGCATPKVWNQMENIQFVPGTYWCEESAGTNAIGTAIYENKPTQVFANEHFCQGWHDLICSAAPIHEPLTGELLGVLDLTGKKNLVQNHNLHLVINEARKIERRIYDYLQKENKNTYEKIMNTINEPVFIFNKKGTIVNRNEIAKNLFDVGNSILSILGKNIFKELQENDFSEITTTCILNNIRWQVTLIPHLFDQTIFGGIAIFKADRPVINEVKSQIIQNKNVKSSHFQHIITNDKNMLQLIGRAKKAAKMNQDILITGESGVGKEVLVQAIHATSTRRNKPLVSLNCGALPKDLLASELFGYKSGAFTGAHEKGKKGKFVYAHEGTLFLDEISEMPIDAQAYLLRVLEEREVVPLGGNEPIPIDVRIISATNRNLLKEIDKGNFRQDLYYRINVLHLEIPPLRKRKGDIRLLVQYFLNNLNEEGEFIISEEAIQALKSYHWPGNVRQLKHVIHQSLLNDFDKIITVEDLPKVIFENDQVENSGKGSMQTFNRSLTKNNLILTLEETNYNIAKTARIFDVSRTTIYSRIKEYNIKLNNRS